LSRTGKGKGYSLWEWSLSKREDSLIVEVTDYCECRPPAEGVDWHPVVFSENGLLTWRYSTCGEGASGITLWKTLTIDPLSRTITKSQTEEDSCER
jgi:hypothetical protein